MLLGAVILAPQLREESVVRLLYSGVVPTARQ